MGSGNIYREIFTAASGAVSRKRPATDKVQLKTLLDRRDRFRISYYKIAANSVRVLPNSGQANAANPANS